MSHTSVDQVAEVLVYLGVIGTLQFAALAFGAHHLRSAAAIQLPALTMLRVRRRMAGPAVRHARLFAGLSAATLVAGVVLGL